MSFQEIKQQVERLSIEEQMRLESFLKAKRVADAAGFRERISAAHHRFDAGEGMSSEQLRSYLATRQSAAS